MSGKHRKLFDDASGQEARRETADSKKELEAIEADLQKCQVDMNHFMRPLKDLREQIAALKSAITRETQHVGSVEPSRERELATLQAQERPLEARCKQRIKESGFLDMFVELNDRKTELLAPINPVSRKPRA